MFTLHCFADLSAKNVFGRFFKTALDLPQGQEIDLNFVDMHGEI
jgi:hypothetical protein